MTDNSTGGVKGWFLAMAILGVLVVLTMVTIIYAKEAEQEAREVRRELKELNVTAQIRCMSKVILSYPPPVSEGQYTQAQADFDQCIRAETGEEE